MNNLDINREEINIAEAIGVLFKNKLLIICLALLFSIIFYGVSKVIPDQYRSSTLLQINSSNNENSAMSSLASQYGGLASLAGISLPSSSGDKSQYVIETARSREFVEHLMTFEMVTENIIAADSYNKSNKKIVYDPDLYDFENKKWIRSLKKFRQVEPSILEVHKELLKNLTVTKDLDSGFITISYTHLSPVFSKELIDLIVDQINEVSRDKDLEESEKALVFLENQLTQYQQVELIKSINAMIKSQLQTKMMANISDDYLVKTIDKPYVPEIKSFPSRVFFAALGFFVGLVISISYILIQFSWSKE
tara:strand:- start:2393 stop:3316 length:924 start_codon:yes stop_codon:yes gene_type:complete